MNATDDPEQSTPGGRRPEHCPGTDSSQLGVLAAIAGATGFSLDGTPVFGPAHTRSNLRRVTDWSPERCAELRRLWNVELLSASEIARELGSTRNAVIGKAHRLKLDARAPRRPPRPVDNAPKRWRRPPKPRTNTPALNVPAVIPSISTSTPAAKPLRLVHLRSLKACGCRWMDGDPRQLMFCGRSQQADSSYCPAHHVRAHKRVA